MTRPLPRKILTLIVFAWGLTFGVFAESPSCSGENARGLWWVYGPAIAKNALCDGDELGAKTISFSRTDDEVVFSRRVPSSGGTRSTEWFALKKDSPPEYFSALATENKWAFEILRNHLDALERFAPRTLAVLLQRYPELAQRDAPATRGSAGTAIASIAGMALDPKKTPTTDPLKSQSQQSQERLRDAQTRADADAQRKGQRSHDPALEAHECIVLDADRSLYGGFRNQCSFKVSYVSCNFRPKTIKGGFNYSADFDCAKQSMGGYDTGGGGRTLAHTHNTEKVYWYACKAPASAVDAKFVEGEGITARCQ